MEDQLQHWDITDRFQLLPTEVQLQILRYIPVRQLAISCARVSSYWRELTKDVSLWKHLSLKLRSEEQTQASGRLLQRCPALVTLKIKIRQWFQKPRSLQPIFKQLVLFPALKMLSFSECEDLNSEKFYLIVTLCPLLEYLCIDSCVNVNAACFNHIAKLENLKLLMLDGVMQINDECIDIISSGSQQLKHLEIASGEVSDTAVIHLLHQRGHELQTLDLDGHVGITDDCVVAIATVCQHLQHLAIFDETNITYKSLEVLSSLKRLHSIFLYIPNDISGQDICKFFSKVRGLKRLGMQSNAVDDEIFKIIFKSQLSLEDVFLFNCNKITDTGMQYLMEGCKNLEHMNLLYLDRITGSFLKDIAHKLQKFKTLGMEFCENTDDSLVEKFFETMPHIRKLLNKL